MAAGDWVEAGLGVGAMGVSWGLSSVVGGGRSHWEWVPGVFGVVEVVGALPRAVGAPAGVLLWTDTVGRAVWNTGAYLVVRAAVLGVRRVTRRQEEAETACW
ncbi:hypothetical protein ABT095_12185 [Kitasatospora sp. NPDC002227]|uniref:hypothetical protein n=1 Tax=Kitasatospora sp. NPDC002227 TaxID=3154773 RepID=UPI003320504B